MLYSGRCHCGGITYQVEGPVVKSSACDCEGCRRATSTFSAPFVTFGRAGLTITSGEPRSFKAASGEGCDQYGVWHFCPDCGSHLYWMPNDGDMVDVFAGSLDDASIYQP